MRQLPIEGSDFGAEFTGIDLAKPLGSESLAPLVDALDRRLVLVIRGQMLSDPELIAFSERLGELDPPGPNPYGEPFHPGISATQRHFQRG